MPFILGCRCKLCSCSRSWSLNACRHVYPSGGHRHLAGTTLQAEFDAHARVVFISRYWRQSYFISILYFTSLISYSVLVTYIILASFTEYGSP